MDNTITEFFNPRQYQSLCREEERQIAENLENLRQGLSKEQRLLLLRIIDGKNLIAETTAAESFADGFRLAARLMVDTFYLKG